MSEVKFTTEVTDVRAFTVSEVLSIYQVSWKVMQAMMKPHLPKIGKRYGDYYTPKQILTIFIVLGLPGKIEETY